MNERITELAEQCTDYVYGEGGSYEMFDKEKFAELIIKECASHLNWVGDDAAGIELLEHFGVEE
jgi:hypothetical protein